MTFSWINSIPIYSDRFDLNGGVIFNGTAKIHSTNLIIMDWIHGISKDCYIVN